MQCLTNTTATIVTDGSIQKLGLPSEMLKRDLREGKDVFAKISNRSVEPGWTFYMYGSGYPRALLAEARITNAKHMKPMEVWDTYEDRLFQQEEEFKSYISGRRHKDMLVLELENIEEYDEPVTPPGNVTVAGLYVDETMQKQIEKRKRKNLLLDLITFLSRVQSTSFILKCTSWMMKFQSLAPPTLLPLG